MSQSDPPGSHLIFRIIDFGRKQTFFTFNHLVKDLKLDDYTAKYVFDCMVSQQKGSPNPNHLLVLVEKNNELNSRDWVYGLLPNAIIQYVDYLEIVEARKAASDAKSSAGMALIVSYGALAISVVIGLAQIIMDVVLWIIDN